ncbi:MAG: hypothetical protein MZW92_25100 [Comamonadaceae bacterium]|nr:hypothetical protein [Comamonadaceae bacterium]
MQIMASAVFRYFPRKESRWRKHGRIISCVSPEHCSSGTIMIILIHQLLLALLGHSNINFEGYKVDELSLLSIVGIGSLFFLFFAAGAYILKIINDYHNLSLLPIFARRRIKPADFRWMQACLVFQRDGFWPFSFCCWFH